MARRTLHLLPMIAAAVLAVACVVTLLLAVSGEKAQAAFPGKNGRIAFSAEAREPGSTSQIFTINPDGTGERRLTHTPSGVNNDSPAYSPDGEKIAWGRNGDIWVMDADGTGKHRLLASGPAYDFDPAFSPDGREVAFARGYSGDRGSDIYVKKLKGGQGRARRVTAGGNHHEYDPVFSPDGGTIAFTRETFSPCCADVILGDEIATVRPDGTGLKVLTHTPGAEPGSPDWSPDGRKLVFALSVGVGGRIQTIEADGTKSQTIFAPGHGFSPYGTVFSPDGKKIAFENYQSVKNVDDIWTVGAHCKNPTDVTHTPAAERWEFSPDWGSRLATTRYP